MQPTVSPWAWVSSWDRRARTRAAGEYAHSRDRVVPRTREHDKYAFYGLRKDSRHFIRLDPLAKGLLLNRQWAPTSAPVTWRVDRFHDSEPWTDIKSIQSYRPYEPVSIVLPGDAVGAPRPALSPGLGAAKADGPITHAWNVGARSWAAGGVALVVLVLLVRAAENCLHKKLFKAIYAHTNAGAGDLHHNEMRPGHYRLQGVRRQESDEWSTPNVMATSLQLQHRDFDTGSLTRLEDIEGLVELGGQHNNNDMPPPYSECASSSIDNINEINKFVSEEPPPPYSACSVTKPKDEESVIDDRAHCSIDNVQNDLIENGLRGESAAITNGNNDAEDVTPGMKTELVFDNGRVVERQSLGLNINDNETGVDGNDNVQEQSTRHADFKDRVVYVDETVAENTTPDTALLV